MGPEGIKLMNHQDILSYEEMVSIVESLAELGIKKVRITGGEPLVRKGLEGFIEQLSAIKGIEDIALTTNGQELALKVQQLKHAGLTRVNISLDSLDACKYAYITRGGSLDRVLKGIYKAIDLDLHPVKLNVVLIKGFNDDEIIDFLEITRELPINLRFIEYMPIGGHDSQWRNSYLSLDKIGHMAYEQGWDIVPENGLKGNGTAENFRLKGAAGTIGFIHPVSKHFCSSCSRLRLTADGKIKNCLFWSEEIKVRPFINNKAELQKLVLEGLKRKPQKHIMDEFLSTENLNLEGRLMSQIGG